MSVCDCEGDAVDETVWVTEGVDVPDCVCDDVTLSDRVTDCDGESVPDCVKLCERVDVCVCVWLGDCVDDNDWLCDRVCV